tara:strand:+ start:251 stop:703 length:453 start_codon:yes stop_codon:yes gene_type:complete
MATRATIAKLDDNGVKAIYLHSDGYLNHAGKILDQHYKDKDKVNELLAHGDVSMLDENIGVKIDFNDYKTRYANKQCKFYNRDRGEDRKEAATLKDENELIEFATEKCDAEYIYMFAYGSWYVYDVYNGSAYGELNQFKELEEELYVPIR